MTEITKHRRDTIEYLENDDQVVEFLDLASSYIGRIVIELNSLEDSISLQIAEIVSSSELQDDLVSVFLADMPYSKKVTTLTKLYGQTIDDSESQLHADLAELEARLLEAGRRRNQYAHATWSDVGEDGLIQVKVKAKRSGVYHLYRKFDEGVMQSDLDYITGAHDDLLYFQSNFE